MEIITWPRKAFLQRRYSSCEHRMGCEWCEWASQCVANMFPDDVVQRGKRISDVEIDTGSALTN